MNPKILTAAVAVAALAGFALGSLLHRAEDEPRAAYVPAPSPPGDEWL